MNGRFFLTVLAIVMAALMGLTGALAQSRQPASLSTLPTSSPQEFDLLDNTGKWMSLGTASGGVFNGLAGAIYLKSFGAKCDGVSSGTTWSGTDDTAALQAWLAKATQKSKLVGMPGACLFKSALVIPAVDDLIVDFQGAMLRYQGTNTTNDILSIGYPANDCVAHRVLVQNIVLISDTVMTAGAGLKAAEMCLFRLDHAYFSNVWQLNNFYNGCHFWGGNQVFINDYSCRGTNADEIDNGNDAAHGSIQSTDMYHYNGVLGNGNIGLLIAGNCGGCYWDSMDVVNNHRNVVIDQSVAGIYNKQIRFGPNFASDGTSGAPNNGVEIVDSGNPSAVGPGLSSEFFCQGCWISTAANDCLIVDAGINYAIVLEGARIRNCGRYGINNASNQIHIIINGGQLARNGDTGLFNSASLPWIQFLSRPSMYGNVSHDFIGLLPTVASGCGGADAAINVNDDYDYQVTWGSTAGQTTCAINYGSAHSRSASYVGISVVGTNTTANVTASTNTKTGQAFTLQAPLAAGNTMAVLNRGVGF